MKCAFFIVFLCCFLVKFHAQYDFQNQIGGREITSYAYEYGQGISVFDIDENGTDEIIIPSSYDSLWIIEFNGEEVSFIRPIYCDGIAKHALFGDIDNDGDNDLYLTFENAPNRLYRNHGNYQFQDVTGTFGVGTLESNHYGAAFGDIDNDGFLDILAGSNSETNSVLLFRNNNGTSFTNVTEVWGAAIGCGHTFQGTFFDYNKDGKQDIHFANDRAPIDGLMVNHDDFFINQATGLGFDVVSNSMSSSIADYNHDGELDIFVTNTPNINCGLWQLNEQGFYQDYGIEKGLGFYRWSWAANWVDWNNDSWEDLYICNNPQPNDPIPFFMNQTGESFVPISDQPEPALHYSFSCAKGDFNGDGFYDLVISNASGVPVQMLKNQPNENHYLRMRLEGTVSNRNGIGSWIRYTMDGDTAVRYTRAGDSFMTQDSQWLILGTGSHDHIDYLEIKWLSGIVDRYYNLPVDTNVVFVEGQREFAIMDAFGNTSPLQVSLCPNEGLTLNSELGNLVLWSNGESSNSIYINESTDVSYSFFDEWGLEHYSDTVHVWIESSPSYAQNIIPPTCHDTQNGVAEIQIFSPSWFATPENYQDLSGGQYSFILQTSLGCTQEVLFEIQNPLPIEIAIGQESTLDNTIEVFISGGTGDLALFLDGELQSSTSLTLMVGSHVVEVIDYNGCIATKIVVVESEPETPPLVFDQALELALGLNELNGHTKSQWLIYDLNGKKISTTATYIYQLNQYLAAGIYFVQPLNQPNSPWQKLAVVK